ncbi:hypothetical protein DFH07DRAFT_728729 [Mycena maculata]|uniref:BTB domain-containing protein n=1 Tax=Mycena maculata TaxID=230809 RepID=A0AAD7KCT3_9AGAR|nr:hypothetical protein DFH07DRAFT_728729 [Mycena maculata]
MLDSTTAQSAAVPSKVANSPFDDRSADLILQSFDNVDFYVHKLLLSLISSFFKDVFSLRQNPNMSGEDVKEGDKEFPVIRTTESGAILGGLLLLIMCSRLQSPHPSLSSDMFGAVIDVAARYDMDWVAKMALRDPHLLKTNPLLLFAHACQKGWAAEVTLAAQGTLRSPIAHFPHDPALKKISGFRYHSLLKFHKRYVSKYRDTVKSKLLQEEAGPKAESWIQEEVMTFVNAESER